NLRSLLLATTALSFFVLTPAHAGDATADAIKSLQAQVNALQKQLTVMQKAKAEAPVAAPAAATEAKKEILPGVSVKLGGYVAMEGVYRDRSQDGDISTNYNTITLGHTAASNRGEFRGSARQTRLSLLAEGKASPNMNLGAYVESDFLGTNGAYSKTNSHMPRLRQAFGTVDLSDWGLHVLAGQAWSLATSSKAGISPRGEDLPLVIDGGMLPGVVYTRNAQLRIVKDFADNNVHVALSAESPDAVGHTAPSNVTTSSGYAPDLIGKVSYDNATFGHYEAFGMSRFFTSTLKNQTIAYQNDNEVGYGVGVSAYVPLIAKKLELHANFMTGKGIGRYGVVAMPDFSYTANGQIKLIEQMIGMVGLIGHPTPTLDAYLYVGAEKAMRQNNVNGYGVGVSNANCYALAPTTACAGVTESVWTIAPGIWNTVYKGDYGNLKVGAQYSLSRRDAFSDTKQPHAFENIGLVSFRYAPF
ncbi:MAG: hypothetical protein WC654_07070, partial [Patescibacteria group bacterium]